MRVFGRQKCINHESGSANAGIHGRTFCANEFINQSINGTYILGLVAGIFLRCNKAILIGPRSFNDVLLITAIGRSYGCHLDNE